MITFLENLECLKPTVGDLRAEVVAQYLARKKESTLADMDFGSSLNLLNRLYRANRLWLKSRTMENGIEIDIYYTPSSKAIEIINEGESPWSGVLENKVRKMMRTSYGIILKFISEDQKVSVDVFTTDWSPCPAACALALHRLHPFLVNCTDLPLTGSHFTGKYVRHPLTGDLLPVWTADWVRGDYGTGAVLVNPAHSQADLEFGREVGLPIKFSLLPDCASDDPKSWPQPPVSKTGSVVRSGRFDELKWDEAQAAFFNVLQARSLAKEVVDKSLDSMSIATVQLSDTGSLGLLVGDSILDAPYDPASRRVASPRYSRRLRAAQSTAFRIPSETGHRWFRVA